MAGGICVLKDGDHRARHVRRLSAERRASRARLSRLLAGAVCALALSACSSDAASSAADRYVSEHESGATRAASAVRTLEGALRRARPDAEASRRQELERAAELARRAAVRAGEWSSAGSGEAGSEGEPGSEDEDLPRAEAQVTEGADQLAQAAVSVEAYERRAKPSARALSEAQLARGRELWNEGITQLWFLAHRRNPPTV